MFAIVEKIREQEEFPEQEIRRSQSVSVRTASLQEKQLQRASCCWKTTVFCR